MWCRQEGGILDCSEVPAHEAALQGAVSLASQAHEGQRFSPAQLHQAAEPLQVTPPPVTLPALH